MATISGGNKLKAVLKELSGKVGSGGKVRVGFLENAKYPDGTPVALVAAVNNWGAPAAGVPPRPFFSNMSDAKSPAWGGQLAKILVSVDYDVSLALDRMGFGIEGQLRQAITDFSGIPLKQSTVDKKGFDKQLVDTGFMLGSVDHEVVK